MGWAKGTGGSLMFFMSGSLLKILDRASPGGCGIFPSGAAADGHLLVFLLPRVAPKGVSCPLTAYCHILSTITLT